MRFVPLAEVADIAMGTAPPGISYNDTGDGIPMIAGAGDFGIDFPSPKKWTTEASRIASPGDLIVCVRATIGDLNWADKEYCLGRGVAGVRAKTGTADIRYLARVIEAKKEELSRLGSGSTFLALRRKEIEEFPIPLPPLDEQRRIVAVLDKADALRRQRQESLQLTEKLLQSVFVEMFGTETSPRYPRVKLSDHLEFITTGGRGWAKYYSNEGSQFIRSLDVRMNEIDSSQMVCVTPPQNAEAERTRTREGDVLLTMTGSLIGRVAPVTAQHAGGYISQHVAILRANGFQPEFLSWAISTKEGQRQIQKHQTGQTKPGLNFEQVRRLLVPRPSIEDENKFCDLIRRRRIILADQRASLAQCENLFAATQQRAFRGELDLSRLTLEALPATEIAPELPGHHYNDGVYNRPGFLSRHLR